MLRPARHYERDPLAVRRHRRLATADSVAPAHVLRRRVAALDVDIRPLGLSRQALLRFGLEVHKSVAVDAILPADLREHFALRAGFTVVRERRDLAALHGQYTQRREPSVQQDE